MAVQRSVAEHWKQCHGQRPDAGVGTHRNLARRVHQSVPTHDFNGSIGLPISSTEISIRDDDGKELGDRRSR